MIHPEVDLEFTEYRVRTSYTRIILIETPHCDTKDGSDNEKFEYSLQYCIFVSGAWAD